ncbi:GNAT family N-acetyltransferase [Micromonospora echinofusca]|uniref:GNAT family N-acetyltransferase n=1 Tax=Micromonospora echinofusca TaxID=47858 RepID=A0ABS3W1B0_MICEH|nr:GNAT family N-acetyltransferase [Micromonospora echinofusca]MBO4210570.1 GNAT family N-acetyltransferase [Micromonospora echinofusca]
MEIRRLTTDELATHSFPLRWYAFQPSPSTADDTDRVRRLAALHEDNRTLVVLDGDTSLATATAIPMRQNVRGAILPMAGVAGVASHPLSRRQGHVRRLLHQLLDEMRDEGHLVSALYPFRPSFYERFGYVGLPQTRTATFAPQDLGPLLRADLPGEVTWQRISAGYPRYREYTERCLPGRHGFSIFCGRWAERVRDSNERWLVTAEIDGTTVGTLTYRIDDHAGDLVGDDLLAADPVARALLLRFLAGHAGQVTRVRVEVPADEFPELWGTDFGVTSESRVSQPDYAAPMARVLSLAALPGLPAGPGRVRIELAEDRYLAGSHLLDGTSGHLEVGSAGASAPTAVLTAAGLSALVYGVLDPVEVVLRGHGTIGPDAAAELRRIFPRQVPYLFSAF